MSAVAAEDEGTGSGGFLGWVERVGNKVPHPAIIFLGLIVGVIVFSAVLSWFDVSVTSEVAEQVPTTVTQEYDGGTTYPSLDHAPRGAGPRLRDRHRDDRGQEPAQRRRDPLHLHDGGPELQRLRRRRGDPDGDDRRRRGRGGGPDRRADPQDGPGRADGAITFIIVLLGGISSVASDAGYLVLIPLGAAAFASLGRNPLAGIAAAYAGVSAAFFVNILITPADGIITEVTNEIMAGVAPNAEPLNVTSNFYFAIASTLFLAVVMTVLTERYVEPRLGHVGPGRATRRRPGRPRAERRRAGPRVTRAAAVA